MNVNYLASSALQATYSTVPIQIYLYQGQTNNLWKMTETYSDPISANANMQLMTRQQLEHIEGYNQSRITWTSLPN